MNVLLILLLAVAAPQSFQGKVVAVHDGDTITVLHDKEQIKVRFEGIDAPETKQDFGTKARQALSKKVFGKQVTVEWTEKDQYGRTLGKVILDKRWINNEMVQDGMAWHYKRYSKDKTLSASEEKAKKAKKGLWSQPNPTPPWEFRKEDKKKAA